MCWKCKKQLELSLKLSFRAVCPDCGADLHVCAGCRYYAPGKPNDCSVPGTEWIRDREAANFCEEFQAKSDRDPPNNGKDKFHSLFKD